MNRTTNGQAFDACPLLFLGNGLAVVLREELLDVRFAVEDFSAEKNKRYLPCRAVFLQGTSAYFQQVDHLLVREVSLTAERRVKTLHEFRRVFGTLSQCLQRRGDTLVVCRNYMTVIHISVDLVGLFTCQVLSCSVRYRSIPGRRRSTSSGL